MPRRRNAAAVSASSTVVSRDECIRVLDRSRFGHLTFVLGRHVEAVPIRFTSAEGWLYFRATAALRDAITHNPWVVITIAELLGPSEVTSVVARGGCYPTERTGSTAGNARALRGIVQLRDRVPAGIVRVNRSKRRSIVFRMYLEELRGRRIRLSAQLGVETVRPIAPAVRRPVSEPHSGRLDVELSPRASPHSHSVA